MAKAVLVMDMPENCEDCPAMRIVNGYYICQAKRNLNRSEKRPDWCPLRELPERANHPEHWDNGRFDKGWNACLDEILKKRKE